LGSGFWKIPAESQRSFANAQDDSAFGTENGKEEAIAEKYSYVQKLICDRLFFCFSLTDTRR